MKHSLPLQAHPPQLATYLGKVSTPTWKQFRNEERSAYDELCSALSTRQRGLCAFCELDLVTSVATTAREVEHWRPKSLDVPPSFVCTFGIDNLQLGCLGGSNRYPVADVDRTSDPPPGPNLSCGAWKGNCNPDDGVNGVLPYRPQDIPESPAVFSVDFDGALRPIAECAKYGLDTARLWATIDFLGLNCTRLKIARSTIRKQLDEDLTKYLDAEADGDDDVRFDEAYLKLAQDNAPPSNINLPRFVTTIRSYFGPVLDNVLFSTPGWSIVL